MNYIILAFFVFILGILALNEDTRIALLFTPIWFVILWAFYSMLNTDDEDALSEELIEMAGVKEIYKTEKEDSMTYYIKSKLKSVPCYARAFLLLHSREVLLFILLLISR